MTLKKHIPASSDILNKLIIHVIPTKKFIHPLGDARCKIRRMGTETWHVQVSNYGDLLVLSVKAAGTDYEIKVEDLKRKGKRYFYDIYVGRNRVLKRVSIGSRVSTFPEKKRVTRSRKSVSVIIVTHNRQRMLESTLQALMPQIRKDDEVLVIDDGSTDNTVWMIGRLFPTVKYIQMEHQGYRMATMKNTGIQAARNEIIILLDDDCIPTKRFVESYRRKVKKGKVLLGGIDFLNEAGEVIYSRNIKNIPLLEGALEGGYGGNVCFYRDDALDVGLWDEEYNGYWGYADTDFLLKLKESGRQLIPVFSAKVKHQWHPRHPTAREGKKRNKTLLKEKMKSYDRGIFPKAKRTRPKPPSTVKLIVGWIGETKRGIKRFKPARRAVNNVDGAILRVASRSPETFIPHNKMPGFYAGLDSLLVSSQTEGHPLIVYEAMACGIPVVSTDVGDVSGIIKNGYNGILVPRYCDIKDISKALEEIKAKPKKRRLMGLRGMIEIHRNWTWEKWIPRYVEMFNYVLEKTNNTKKSKIKVLILVDTLNWAWGFMAQEMKKFLPRRFICEIKTHEDCESGHVDYGEYDIIYNHVWTKIKENCYQNLPLERMIIHVGGEAFHDSNLGKPELFNRLVREVACVSSVSRVWLPELEGKRKTFHCSRGVDTTLFKPSNGHKIRLTFIVDEPRWTYGILAKEISKRLPPYYGPFIVKPQKVCKRKLHRKSDILYNWMWARRGVCQKLPKEKTIIGVNGEKYLSMPNVFAEAVENAAIVLVNSTKIYKDVTKKYPQAHVRLAHTGIDTDLFHPAKIYHNDFRVGWIGNPARTLKRYPLAEKAVLDLEKVTFRPLLFHRDKPHLLIPHEEMPHYYNSLDCHLVVSTSESHSQQTYEAMACGLPAITTNVGCIDENVKHMENGILLPVDCTIQEIRDAILLLRDDPALRERLGQNARKTILEKVTWNQPTSMPAYLKAFEEVILAG